MNTTQVKCPACDSSDVVREDHDQARQLTLGPVFHFLQTNYTCNSCGEEGDFDGRSDTSFIEAKKNAEKVSVKNLIENLTKHDVSMAYFERVFELPARTVTRWKSGDYSSSGVALLRAIATYPWIAEVAEKRFDPNYAKLRLIKEGAQALMDAAGPKTSVAVGVEISDDKCPISASVVWRPETSTITLSSMGNPLELKVAGG